MYHCVRLPLSPGARVAARRVQRSRELTWRMAVASRGRREVEVVLSECVDRAAGGKHVAWKVDSANVSDSF